MRLIADLITAPDRATDDSRALRRTALASGAIFVVAGLVKFVLHHWELHAFRSFGLPFPSVLEIIAGVVETGGGLLLMVRRGVVPVTIVLSVTMVVAIISSGIDHGDVIPSLTLAPALLVAMLLLLAGSLWRRRPDMTRAPVPASPAQVSPPRG